MSLKRYISVLLVAAVFFVAGVLVGRFIMPRKVHITVVNIKDIVDIIERYNEAKHELGKVMEWNKNAIIESEPEEEKENE